MGKKGTPHRKWSKEEKLYYIHLHLDEHLSVMEIERRHGVRNSLVSAWVKRYLEEGEDALEPKNGNPYAALHTSKIHLVSFTGLCDVPAATVSLRRNQLALGWNKVFVGGDILFYNGCPAFKTGLSQTLQHYRGVLDSLAQQTVQQAGITAECCDRMFTAFGAPRQILEAVFLESAQSATRYAGSSF